MGGGKREGVRSGHDHVGHVQMDASQSFFKGSNIQSASASPGPLGHGRWVPGGTLYSSSLSSRGFGQAEAASARADHPSDRQHGTDEKDRVERADRAAMWFESSPNPV